MKICKYQSKYFKDKIRCKNTGIIRWNCDIENCKHFKPTLFGRISRLLHK